MSNTNKSTGSNNISRESVKKVGNLSRLFTEIGDSELDKYQSQLSAVLDYADELSKIDTTGFSPHQAIATIGLDDLRVDEVDEDTTTVERIRQNILNNFPARQGDFLQLPIRIIEEN
jgi:aspartyl-tRNA(Asn)/glutamyl-tRNA(Gln) amidotransferase subunit C